MSRIHEILRAEGARTRQIILSAISKKEKSAPEICQEIGVCRTTVQSHLKLLRKLGKRQVWIARWEYSHRGSYPTAFYACGNQADAPKPERPKKKPRTKKLMVRPIEREVEATKMNVEGLMERAQEKKVAQIKPPPAVNDPFLAWILRRAA